MGSVYRPRMKNGKRGDWYIQWREEGKRYKRRIGPIKKEAEMALMDTEQRARLRRTGRAADDIPIDKFFDEFIAYSQTNHAPGTTKRYNYTIKRFKGFLRTKRGITSMTQITPRLIEQFKAHRRADRRVRRYNLDGSELEQLRASFVNLDLRVLSICFNAAARLRHTLDNPVKGVAKLKENDSRPFRWLSQEDCGRLLAHCSAEFRPVAQLMLNTGVRRGEMENLKWDDVDLRRKVIKIQAKGNWRPKNGEREVPLNPAAIDAVKDLRRLARGSDHDYVLQSRSTGNFIPRQLRMACDAAGVERIAPHDLRHSFATNLAMRHPNPASLQRILGHASVRTTMRYVHLAQGHLADAVETLEIV